MLTQPESETYFDLWDSKRFVLEKPTRAIYWIKDPAFIFSGGNNLIVCQIASPWNITWQLSIWVQLKLNYICNKFSGIYTSINIQSCKYKHLSLLKHNLLLAAVHAFCSCSLLKQLNIIRINLLLLLNFQINKF